MKLIYFLLLLLYSICRNSSRSFIIVGVYMVPAVWRGQGPHCLCIDPAAVQLGASLMYHRRLASENTLHIYRWAVSACAAAAPRPMNRLFVRVCPSAWIIERCGQPSAAGADGLATSCFSSSWPFVVAVVVIGQPAAAACSLAHRIE